MKRNIKNLHNIRIFLVLTIFLFISIFITVVYATNWVTIPSFSPKFYYSMNDTTGDIKDFMGNYNRTTPAGLTRGISAFEGTAYQFNGISSNSAFTTGYTVDVSKDLAVTFLVNPSLIPNYSGVGGDPSHIVSSYNCGYSPLGGFDIALTKNSETSITIRGAYSIRSCVDTTNNQVTITNSQIDFSKWHMITYTFQLSNGRWSAYVDKNYYAGTSTLIDTSITGAGTDVNVGCQPHAGSCGTTTFKGVIDDLALYQSNLTSQNVSDIYDSYGLDSQYSNITIIPFSPINNLNQTSLSVNISCNFTAIRMNISSVRINVYNSSNFLNFSQNITLGGGNVSYNKTWTNLNFTIGIWNWSCFSFGDNGNNFTSVNRTFNIANDSLNLINFTTNPENVVFGSNLNLKANLSYGLLSYYFCNFSLAYPNGTMIFTNQQGSNLNGISSSNTEVINQIGIYKSNVTCFNNFGSSVSASKNLSISYSFIYNPTDYLFSALNTKNETNSFNVTLFDDINTSITFNLTTDIQDRNNFTLRLSTYSLVLNNSDNSSNPVRVSLFVNGSNQVANGTYSGNITMSNSTLGLNYLITFTYGISPPSSKAEVYDSNNTEYCTDSFYSNCTNINALSSGSTITKTYTVRNTGYFDATDCYPAFSNQLAGLGWVTFSNSSFSMPRNINKTITASFSPTAGVTAQNYIGYFYVQCNNADLLGHNISTLTSNRPLNTITVLNGTSAPPVPPTTSAGGGGGGTMSRVVALIKPVQDTNSYTDLSRAIIFARIRNFTQIYGTDLSEIGLNNLSNILLVDRVVITPDLLRFWLENYINKQYEVIEIDSDQAKSYNLVKAEEIYGSAFRVVPASINTYTFVNLCSDNSGKKWVGEVTANKILSGCSIKEGKFNCTITNPSVAELSYTFNNSNFVIDNLEGIIDYYSVDNETARTNIQYLNVINVCGKVNIFGMKINLLIVSGIIIAVVGVLIWIIIKLVKKRRGFLKS